jgi:hypothetical protein
VPLFRVVVPHLLPTLSVRKPSKVRGCEIPFLVESVGYCVDDKDKEDGARLSPCLTPLVERNCSFSTNSID